MYDKSKFNIIKNILIHSWSKETCYPPLSNIWSKKNPYLGQCAVTSLVLQDIFGGELLYNVSKHHYWNKLPNGEVVDFTIHQFGSDQFLNTYIVKERDEILNKDNEINAKTLSRYLLLKKRVEKQIRPELFFVKEIV